MAARIMLVEDDDAVREAVTVTLRSSGYEVLALANGLQAREDVQRFSPDLAVLDVRLDVGPNGFGVARELRAVSDVPVLFLTAANALDDRLAGFAAGADDYLAKPFAVAELLARVRAILARRGGSTRRVWEFGDLSVDADARRVVYGGTEVALTKTEFDLLVQFVSNPSRVRSKTALLTSVWGYEHYDPNLVEVYVATLRRKLEEHGPRLIHTVRGVGYVLRN